MAGKPDVREVQAKDERRIAPRRRQEAINIEGDGGVWGGSDRGRHEMDAFPSVSRISSLYSAQYSLPRLFLQCLRVLAETGALVCSNPKCLFARAPNASLTRMR